MFKSIDMLSDTMGFSFYLMKEGRLKNSNQSHNSHKSDKEYKAKNSENTDTGYARGAIRYLKGVSIPC